MLLSVVMRFVLTKKMKAAAKKNLKIKNKMKLRNFIMAVVTKDRKHGMHFIFKDGLVISGKGDHSDADARLIWIDSITAFKVLASQDNYKMACALMSRELNTEGDVNLIVHFQDIASDAMSLLR